MSLRPIVGGVAAAVFATAATAAVALAPAGAASTEDLYVSPQGQDTAACTAASPCASVQRAVDLAGTTPATVHLAPISPGGYDGLVTVAAGQRITLAGHSPADTSLRSQPDDTAIRSSGDLTLQHLTVSGSSYAVVQHGGALTLTDASLTALSVVVDATDATVTTSASSLRSTSQDSVGFRASRGSASFGGVSVIGTDTLVLADTTFVGTRLDVRATRGVLATASTVRLDASTVSATAAALTLTGSSTAVTRSSVTALGGGVIVDGGGATLVADAISSDRDVALIRLRGVLRVAAGVVTSGTATSCSGAVVDGGYNVVPDHSCGWTGGTSRQDADGLTLQTLPASPRSTTPSGDSPAVDFIPLGATATYNSAVALCSGSSRDVRGLLRPVAGRCDAGPVELGATTVTASATPASSTYGDAGITLVAHVRAATAGPPPAGTVTFTDAVSGAGPQSLNACQDLTVPASGTVTCAAADRLPGSHRFTAHYSPTNGYHPAAGDTATVTVAKAVPAMAVRLLPVDDASGGGTRIRVIMNAPSSSPVVVAVTVDGAAPAACSSIFVEVPGRNGCTVHLPHGAHTVHVHFPGDYALTSQDATATVTL